MMVNMSLEKNQSQTSQGLLYGVLAYILWGSGPIFFALLSQVDTYEIIAHRAIWSLVFLILIITLGRDWHNIVSYFRQPKRLLQLLGTSLLIVSNWTIYVWAVNHHHVLEASLGYFICPLSSILLAVIFLKERFRALQWLALGLAIVGILIQVWVFGSVPAVALGLAFTFSLYGFFRKKMNVPALTGLFFETLWLLPIALSYLIFFTPNSETSNIFHNSWSLNGLLMLLGIITTVPLLLFIASTTRLRLSIVGLLQYIGPTLTFFIGIFIFNEPMSTDKLFTFFFIWLGLALFILDSIAFMKKNKSRVV